MPLYLSLPRSSPRRHAAAQIASSCPGELTVVTAQSPSKPDSAVRVLAEIAGIAVIYYLTARLGRIVQFTQIAKRALSRSVRSADRLHQRPVGVILAVLVPKIRSQKHRRDGDMPCATPARGLVYTTPTFQRAGTENKNVARSG